MPRAAKFLTRIITSKEACKYIFEEVSMYSFIGNSCNIKQFMDREVRCKGDIEKQ